MVVDSSALMAIVLNEPDAPFFVDQLAKSERKFISSFSYLESAIVAEAKKGPEAAKALNTIIAVAQIETVAFDQSQAEVSLDAWRRYGKGRHAAGLNIGDCVSYALAKTTNQTLLFKGNDFVGTDLAGLEIPLSAPGFDT